jgi:hypothetical protein
MLPNDGQPDPQAKRHLWLASTHANCKEIVDECKKQGIPAIAYPQLNSQTCLRYDEARDVNRRGFSHCRVLCPGCAYQEDCLYREGLAAAAKGQLTVATHARGVTSMDEIASGRDVITVEENSLGMIQPSYVAVGSLSIIELVARQAWAESKDDDKPFYSCLAHIAKWLHACLNGSNETEELALESLPSDILAPTAFHRERTLYRAAQVIGVDYPREAMQLTLAATLGNLERLFVMVEERPITKEEADQRKADGRELYLDGGGKPVKLVRRLEGIARKELPADAIVIINDATGSTKDYQFALNQPVTNISPAGRLPILRPMVQVIPQQDVTKARKPEGIVPYLRGVLHDIPYEKVGLLTHQEFAKKLPQVLEEPYLSKLALIDYYGSGLSRGSNKWHRACNGLVGFGTPRMDTQAIREHLCRLGKIRAAKLNREQAGWSVDYWSGVTQSGRRVTVRTPHYTDHDWHEAYCFLTQGELKQAIGRARSILPEGIPVYVVTTENLAPPDNDDGRNGLPIADGGYTAISLVEAKVLNYLAGGIKQTCEIMALLGMTRPGVIKLLDRLERTGRLRRIGERGGWSLVEVKPYCVCKPVL